MPKVREEFSLPTLKASPLSAIEHVYSELKEALMAGDFLPGQPLRLEELAVAFGTSHMPIRESLSRLSGIGILERAQRRSVRVPMISLDQLRQLFEVRLLAEKQAILWATERASGAKLIHIRKINDQMDQLKAKHKPDLKNYLRLNQAFHFSLYELSENKVLLNTIELLWLQAGPVLNLLRGADEALPNHPDHIVIIDNIASGNGPAAAEALGRDLLAAYGKISGLLAKAPHQKG